jgi:hypothetical protein
MEKVTPKTFSSPYFAQGDLGFFSYKKKKYGIFFVAVNHFTRKLFACPIKNTKSKSIIDAIGLMKKNRYFRQINTLLFDGESGLTSESAQRQLFSLYGIKLHAEAGYKRMLAERAVREIKIRTAILLELQGYTHIY